LAANVRLLCDFIYDFIVEYLPAQSSSDQSGHGVPAGALLAGNEQVWSIGQVALPAPPWSPLTLFQDFVFLKNGDLPFDKIFNVNHNNFQNIPCPPEFISGRTLNPTLIPGRFGADFFGQGNYAAP
jgi:hypothetical protein